MKWKGWKWKLTTEIEAEPEATGITVVATDWVAEGVVFGFAVWTEGGGAEGAVVVFQVIETVHVPHVTVHGVETVPVHGEAFVVVTVHHWVAFGVETIHVPHVTVHGVETIHVPHVTVHGVETVLVQHVAVEGVEAFVHPWAGFEAIETFTVHGFSWEAFFLVEHGVELGWKTEEFVVVGAAEFHC